MTRLVRRWLDGETLVKRYLVPLDDFARKFTTTDVALLAETDALHGTLSGPATKYSGSHTDHIQNPTCLKKPLASLGERVCKA